MRKIVSIGIFNKKEDRILRKIGEELIKEKYDNLNFYFITDERFIKGDYIIAFKEDEVLLEDRKGIYLTDSREEDDNIFFYQGKEKIKKEILKKLGGVENKGERLKIIGVRNNIKKYNGTIFSYFLGEYLGDKACWLSLNYLFPYKLLLTNSNSIGLLKALYYFENNEEIKSSVVKEEKNFFYIENDLKRKEKLLGEYKFFKKIISLLEKLNFRYLILESFPLSIINNLDYLIVQNSKENLIEEEILKLEEKVDGVYIYGKDINIGEFYNIKNNKIVFNYKGEECNRWKEILKKQF